MYKANSYKNVMELLVDDEIDRQTCEYSQEQAQRINRIEVAAYALNRVPPLYASSQEGITMQYERGQREFGDRISLSVSQALGQIHLQPHRNSTPLPRIDEEIAQQPLTEQQLQELSDWT